MASNIEIRLADDSRLSVPRTDGQTILSLRKRSSIFIEQAVIAALSLRASRSFDIFEKNPALNFERYLEPDLKVTDIVQRWEAEEKADAAHAPHLLFRKRIFLPAEYQEERQDPIALRLVFNQGLKNILRSVYLIGKDDAIALAGIYFQFKNGDYQKDISDSKVKWADALPSIMHKQFELEQAQWIAAIREQWAAQKGKTADQCTLDYVVRMQKDPYYGFESKSLTTRLITDPNRLSLTLSELAARNLVPMDSNGLSDPYLVIEYLDKRFSTAVQPKTLNPRFSETFELGEVVPNAAIKIRCMDKDTLSDDFEGEIEISTLCFNREGMADEWVPLKQRAGAPAGGELHVRLAASAAVLSRKLAFVPLPHHSRGIFCQPLKDLMAEQSKFHEEAAMPLFFESGCAFIEAHAGEENLFRSPGDRQEYDLLHSGLADDFERFDYAKVKDPRVVADLLKHFLAQLPDEALLTRSLYAAWMALADRSKGDIPLSAFRENASALPPPNRAMLRRFCAALAKVAAERPSSKMDARALSVVVGPVLLWKDNGIILDALRYRQTIEAVGEVTRRLIEHHVEIFA